MGQGGISYGGENVKAEVSRLFRFKCDKGFSSEHTEYALGLLLDRARVIDTPFLQNSLISWIIAQRDGVVNKQECFLLFFLLICKVVCDKI